MPEREASLQAPRTATSILYLRRVISTGGAHVTQPTAWQRQPQRLQCGRSGKGRELDVRRNLTKLSTLFTLGAVLACAAAIATTVILVNRGFRQQALVEAESKARILLDRNWATHTYFSQIMKPRLLEWTAPLRSGDYFEPSWMSSTFAVREIDKYFQTANDAGYYLKDAAVNARSPDNEADEFEKAFLEELNRDPTLESRSAARKIGGRSYYVILRKGEMMEESCLLCHGDPADAPGDLARLYGPERSFHRRVGDLISVISLRVPLSQAYAQTDRLSRRLIGLLVALLCALSTALILLNRRLVVLPMRRVQQKALQIAADRDHVGETIPVPFGRELGDLAAAFNTMSAGLRFERDRLEERVAQRTAEITAANKQLVGEIAERKQTEESLRQQRDFAESLVETAQAIVLVLDTEGRIVRFNPYMEQISGYRLEEVRGADWFSTFLPERDRPRVRDLFQRAIGDIHTRGNVNPIVTKDGREREIEWYDKTLKDAQGAVVGLLSVGQDITERRRAEEEKRSLELRVHHSQKLESLGILAGGIAHDFNNLLMVVLGNTEVTLRHLPSASPARPGIEAIGKAARRAAELTNQMLAYSGRGTFVVGNIDLSQTLEGMAQLLRASVPKRVRLEMRLAPGLPAVQADVAQMQNVVMSLVINAAEAIGEKSDGQIVVETGVRDCEEECLRHSRLPEKRPPGRYVFLSVSDTGCGIEEQAKGRIFEPFYTTKSMGRGLSLAAVSGVVQGHGGAIMLESTVGKGTSLTVLLPALSEKPEAGIDGANPAKGGQPEAAGTVLLVDDEEAVLEVVRLMLEEMGFSVLVAADGPKALEVFEEHAGEIGCVLLDLTMPGMNGEEVFERIRGIRGDARVILSSGYSEADLKVRYGGKGIAGFLQKPYRYESLAAVMGAVARG
jgi:PAS domain S-box-containing protein